LTLVGGIGTTAPDDRFTRDMELELTLRDGRFEPAVWGYAIMFNKAHHDGTVVSAAGDKLAVKLTIRPDRWFPSGPGTAEYQLELRRDGDKYSGTFTGSFGYPGGEKREVKGTVTGKAGPSWSEPRAGFKKLEPNEHPRLVFRKSDLPLIKQRLETPEEQRRRGGGTSAVAGGQGEGDRASATLPARAVCGDGPADPGGIEEGRGRRAKDAVVR
jgi:hypothetical protein